MLSILQSVDPASKQTARGQLVAANANDQWLGIAINKAVGITGRLCIIHTNQPLLVGD